MSAKHHHLGVLKALSHPVRVRAMSVLAQHDASPSQIANEIGIKVANISYHVRILVEAGMVTLIDTRAVRGALEHRYAMVATDAGGIVNLKPEPAAALLADVRARLEEARKLAADDPGDVAVTVVVGAAS